MKKVITAIGELKRVSLKEFVSLIPIEGVSENLTNDDCCIITVTTLEVHSTLTAPNALPETSSPETKKFGCKLRKADKRSPVSLFREDLFKYFDKVIIWKRRDLIEIVEDMITDAAMQFANPEYAIHIAPRTWMLAKPDDLRILTQDDKMCLVPNVACRAKLYIVQKITEDEVVAASDKIMGEFKERFKEGKGDE